MAVAPFLVKGEEFFKKPEGNALSSAVQKCTVRVDDDGMFLLWSFLSQQEHGTLEMTHICEVKTGILPKDIKSMYERTEMDSNISKRILTIYHGFDISNLSIMQFLATSAEIAQKWEKALIAIAYSLKLKHLCPLDITKKQWKRLQNSQNSKGMIPIRRLVKQLGHDKNEKAIEQKLKSSGLPCSKNDEINPKELTFEVYKEVCNKVCTRNDLITLFREITRKRNDYIELKDFVTWLNENQRDPRLNEILVPTFDEKRASALIQKYEHNATYKEHDRLSLQGFADYLSSEDNPLIITDHVQLHQDMDHPLCHYFINSSHNTYLTGRQFRGKSSSDIYRHVLLSGCRCIELDCWDGKGDFHGEPIITHGQAMCTDVSFKSVLYAIKDAAFVTSDFPVILSFETHCSKPLQMKMAKYCEEIFGDMLLNKPLPSHPLQPGTPQPSPNSLKRKILIKNKRLKPEVEKVQLEEMQTSGDAGLPVDTDETGEEAHPELKLAKVVDGAADFAGDQKRHTDNKPTRTLVHATTSSDSTSKTKNSVRKTLTEEDENELVQNYEYVKPSATNIHPLLSCIVNYCQSIKFPGFKKIEEDAILKPSYQMSSFSESIGLNHIKANAIELVNYNKNQLSRIYPRGNRVDSSNFIPQLFWNAGCQLVSLNFQTHDLGEQLNASKFEYNGRCGYLLKPEMLLSENRVFDPFAESTVDGVIAAQCGVKVLSAQFLADKPVSSYVEVDMYGLPNDTIRKEFKTSLVVGNGLNPTYNNEFLFRKVIFPDLAQIRFTLYDDSRQLIGQRSVPLSSLQTGYRYVCLRTASGVPLDSTMIFVKISLRSYVPDSLIMIANALENPKAHQTSLSLQHEKQLKCLEDDIEDERNDVTCDGSHWSVRRTKSNETNDNDSKSNNKNAKGKEIKSKASSKALPSKKPDTGSFETESVSLQTLQSHPTYIKATASHRKQTLKAKKHKDQRQGAIPEISCKKKPKNRCCLVPSFMVGGGEKNKHVARETSNGDATAASFSPEQEKEALLAALSSIHLESLEELKCAHKREMDELEQGQTKQWMGKAKTIRKDKTIPSAERKRRLKEKNNQEVKKFMEERQTLKIKHLKQVERLKSVHDKEVEKLKAEELAKT